MKTLITLTGLLLVMNVWSQDFRNTVGLRLGYTGGITYQFFPNDYQAIEVMAGFRDRGLQVYGLYQHYVPAFAQFSDHLYWYYGLGGHVGFVTWMTDNPDKPYRYSRHVAAPVVGFDGNGGLEYWFYRIPLTIGLDYKPYLELFGPAWFDIVLWDFAFTVKYTF
jgi:hypothetical protein